MPTSIFSRTIENCEPGEQFEYKERWCRCISVTGSVVKYSMPLSSRVSFIDTYDRNKEVKQPEVNVNRNALLLPRNQIRVFDTRVTKVAKGEFYAEYCKTPNAWQRVAKKFKSVTRANEYIVEHFEKIHHD